MWMLALVGIALIALRWDDAKLGEILAYVIFVAAVVWIAASMILGPLAVVG